MYYVISECPTSPFLSFVVYILSDARTHYQLHCADEPQKGRNRCPQFAGSEFGHSCLVLYGPFADNKLRHADFMRIGRD